TFSKSFASLGGFVAGNKDVINYIKHTARSFIFSASLPAPNAMAAFAALEVMETEPEHVQRLWENAAFMLKGYRDLGFNIGATQTPIIPVIIGDDEACFRFWKELFDAGVYCNPVVSPAVPQGMALLRTSYMATHRRDHLVRVLGIFEKTGKKLGNICYTTALWRGPACRHAGPRRLTASFPLEGAYEAVFHKAVVRRSAENDMV
ncbi:MAG: aminotransferase class I/II-fold pyridoxal phosphate-dependent enzyme, partial [Spirochaetia bacterium]|nr:aminotransferase class I/II-fold pyridoxal phosphate-dependent enzyme [Spirochaetia bacterium]